MEEFSIHNTSWDKSYDYGNISSDYNNTHLDTDNSTSYECHIIKDEFIDYVVTSVICVGLPLTLVAIFAICSLVRKDAQVVSVYVINLLISDLIQLCCMTIWVASNHCEIYHTSISVYYFGVMASVGFMVCISLERYLVIAWPLWYRFRRTIKVSVVVCAVVWVLPLVYVLPLYFWVTFELTETIFAVYHLVPFPLLIFFLGGTLKALSAARSVPSDEKRQIVSVLVVVLLIYTLLFMPNILWSLSEEHSNNGIVTYLRVILLLLSPLADLTLYIFMRKGTPDKLLASLCCCRMSSNQQMNSMTTDSIHTVSTV